MGLIASGRQMVINAFSWLRYKQVFADPVYGQPDRTVFPAAMRTWVPDEDRQRLAAYTLLAAYDHNQAGEIARLHDGEAADRVEFGDPSMIVDTLVAHVLGREQQIVVPGAEHADTPDGQARDLEAEYAAQRQEQLRAWAVAELLPLRLQQGERKTVSLGHSAFTMAWDPAKQRPRLSVVDPGFYYPALSEDAGDGGDYPTTVHFAWEIPANPSRPGDKTRVRRITYELGPITGTTTSTLDTSGRPARAAVLADDGTPVLLQGDTTDPATGSIVRQYPWNDRPSGVTCYLTDATWLLEDIKGGLDVYSLDPAYSTPAIRGDGQVLDRLDLQLDFVPVIDLPNSIPDDGYWGVSSMAKLLQGVDALQGADTDSVESSATTGMPPIALWGAEVGRHSGQYVMQPGAAWTLGEGGGMTAINTAPNLAELRLHKNDLRDRLATNARLPAVALGTLDPTKVPSGYALQLSLGPLDSLIASMRLARAHKLRLIPKFAQRLFLAGQHPDWVGPVVDAEIAYGSYTPTDRAAVLAEVTAGYKEGVLSLETGVRMLQDAGYPIEDVAEEIRRIQARRFADATQLANATGDQGAVAEFLGRTPGQTVPPAPVLPPTPGQTVSPEAAQ